MIILNNSPLELKQKLDTAVQEEATAYMKEPDVENSFKRNTKLSLLKVINLILFMQGGSLQKELYNAGIKATPSAFVQKRDKISWFVFENIFHRFNKLCTDTKTFKDYKVFAIDGTTINLPRNPNSDSYVKNDSTAKGYNQFHCNILYDVLNKTYQDCVIQPQPQQDEVGALLFFLVWREFTEKTLIVADRGYESYNVFAHIQNKENVDFLIRVKQDKTAMREIAKLPMTELDVDLSFTITTTQKKVDRENNHIFIQMQKNENHIYSSKTRAGRWDFPSPYPMTIRVVRFQLDTGEYETLATSLPRSVTIEELKELYHSRWGIETAFRELKYSIGLINLHGKKDDFAKQEIFAALTISNLCSRIVQNIVIAKKDNNQYEYSVNIKMAIHICRTFFQKENADEKQLIEDIARHTEPIRQGRKDNRNLKPKSFVGFVYRVSA